MLVISGGMRAVLMWSVIAVIAGCSKTKEEPARGKIVEVRDRLTNELMPLDAVPREILEESARVSELQARGFAGGRLSVHKVWAYRGPSTITPLEDAKRVAIEMTLEIPKGNHFDLDDLDIIDAADGKNYGSDPQLQRVTARSEPAAWEDPVFTDASPLRFVAVWAVPKETQVLQLGYWGETITERLTLGTPGPTLPEYSEAVVAYGTAGRKPSGEMRHLLVVECHCDRTARPPSVQIAAPGNKLGYPVRAVEVDDAMQPLATATERPFYLKRSWVLEVWADPEANQLNDFGQRSPLPTRKLTPSKALLAALEAAPLDEIALAMMKRQ
jgi:hypothetical protein